MKAQLSLNTIIIAAIVLIVLIVLWSIFAGRMGSFTSGVAECRSDCKLKSRCLAVASEGHKTCLDGDVKIMGTLSDDITKRIESEAPSPNDPKVCCLIEKK